MFRLHLIKKNKNICCLKLSIRVPLDQKKNIIDKYVICIHNICYYAQLWHVPFLQFLIQISYDLFHILLITVLWYNFIALSAEQDKENSLFKCGEIILKCSNVNVCFFSYLSTFCNLHLRIHLAIARHCLNSWLHYTYKYHLST